MGLYQNYCPLPQVETLPRYISYSPLMQKLRLLVRLIAVGFAVMSFVGFFRYTTLGIDSDWADITSLTHHYYRIQWPGNGTFHLSSGTVIYPCAPNTCRSDPFDFGGALFEAPKREPPRNVWNSLGFWYYNRSHPQVFTIGVPAILPVFLLLWFAFPFKTENLRRDGFMESRHSDVENHV